MKVNCSNCQKLIDIEARDTWYFIKDNFDKYENDAWCSNCLKAVQKICEKKWGINEDCLFGEYDGLVFKIDDKPSHDRTSYRHIICPWCEVELYNALTEDFNQRDLREFWLDHYYHFHGKDKGKCGSKGHITNEGAKQLENSGLLGSIDIRKLFYVEGSWNLNTTMRERERER